MKVVVPKIWFYAPDGLHLKLNKRLVELEVGRTQSGESSMLVAPLLNPNGGICSDLAAFWNFRDINAKSGRYRCCRLIPQRLKLVQDAAPAGIDINIKRTALSGP